MRANPDGTRLDIDASRAITILFASMVCIELLFVIADAVINVGKMSEIGAAW